MSNKYLLLSILFLSGCSLFRQEPRAIPEVNVITETVSVEIYQPPLPPEIKLDDVKWFVITRENLEEKLIEIEQFTGTEFVVFAVTPQSYENMAYNLQEIRRYIRQQKEIIVYYREATKPKGSESWLQNNTTETITIPKSVDDSSFLSKIFNR